MEFIDIHTHRKESRNAILNCQTYTEKSAISLGIHPWDICSSWKAQFTAIAAHAAADNVAAIGECGIDKLRSQASIETQKEVLLAHIELSEEFKKPIILHCVKGIDEILALYNITKPAQAWIIHGFRGKPQQAKQVTDAGLYISIGEHFNASSAKEIPANRLFIESDESRTALKEIYKAVAAARGCSPEELAAQVAKNAMEVFSSPFWAQDM